MRIAPYLNLAVWVLLVLAMPCTSGARNLQPLPERFEMARVVNLRGGSLPVEAAAPLSVQFTAYGRSLILDLLPAEIFAPGAQTFVVGDKGAVEVPTVNYSFEGTVYGIPESSVRVTLVGDSISGLVAIGSEILSLEPKSDFSAATNPGDIVVYRSGENPLPELNCRVGDPEPNMRFSNLPAGLGSFVNSPVLGFEPPRLRIDAATRREYRLDVG